jgi:hypothetical protein
MKIGAASGAVLGQQRVEESKGLRVEELVASERRKAFPASLSETFRLLDFSTLGPAGILAARPSPWRTEHTLTQE